MDWQTGRYTQNSIILVHYTDKKHDPWGNHHASHFKKVLFTGHNHLLTIGTDDPRWHSGDNQSWIISIGG